MAKILEPGYIGPLVSLAGILGKPGRGRQLNSYFRAVGVAPRQQFLSANSNRISCIIQNVDSETVYLAFAGNTDAEIVLTQSQSFQIDENFPWTGSLMASVIAGTGHLVVWEVTLRDEDGG